MFYCIFGQNNQTKMITYIDAILKGMVIHQVGNQHEGQGFKISKDKVEIKDEILLDLLKQYFFSHFKEPEFYNFNIDLDDLSLHPMFGFISAIFDNPSTLYEQSIEITKHLYAQSSHPNIKAGDLMITYLKEILVDEEIVDAVGIFKSESKEAFLRLTNESENYKVDYDQGISVEKLDKGCLIFNTEAEEGYKICIIDKSNKSEAMYWKEDFLKVKQRPDDYHHTQNYIQLTQSFVKERLQPLYDIDKTEEASIMHRSKSYFNNVEDFDADVYSKKIFMDNPQVINQFDRYKDEFKDDHSFAISEDFSISVPAVKKQGKVFKSVLKLDKNFHIYIHGNHSMIERGTEESGQKFYKIYYDNEQ